MIEYPKHKHPHGINHEENPQRIWVCNECDCSFDDKEVRVASCSKEWGHKCKKAKNIYRETRCESHLESYMPSPYHELNYSQDKKQKGRIDTMKRIILHLCADIGSDSQPYRDAGYDVRCIGKDIGVENYTCAENVYGVIANPVCTEFSIASGFHKVGDHGKGLAMVRECERIIDECQPRFWVIENPASGHLKKYLGKPRLAYEPWQYGSPWTKRTALWGKFNIPWQRYVKWGEVTKNPNLYIRPGRSKPSMAFLHKSAKRFIREFDCFEVEDNMSFRSLCSQKFAKAFFEVNQ